MRKISIPRLWRTAAPASLLVLAIGPAVAQQAPTGTTSMPDMTHSSMHGGTIMPADTGMPTLPGQDAFGAIQEVVRILETDSATDWSKVDLERLRQHLVDMNEVTLKAVAVPKLVDGGLEVAVIGEGRTLLAIQRMVPDQATQLNQMNGWSAKAESLPNGVLLTVTSRDPKAAVNIRGLGFIGLLASGAHHQAHHLAMAKGELPMPQ